MGIFDKLADKVNKSSSSQSSVTFPQAPEAPPLGPDSIYRYRKQRGVNLGAWFVQEKWINDKTFRNAASPAQSDFDIAKGNDAKAIMEEHWDTWMKDEDWTWIKEHGYNSVRLPVSIQMDEADLDRVLPSLRGHSGCVERYRLCSVPRGVFGGVGEDRAGYRDCKEPWSGRSCR